MKNTQLARRLVLAFAITTFASPIACTDEHEEEPDIVDTTSNDAGDSQSDTPGEVADDAGSDAQLDVEDDTTPDAEPDAEPDGGEDVTDVDAVVDATPPPNPVVQSKYPDQGTTLSMFDAASLRITVQFDIDVAVSANDGGPPVEASLQETNSSKSYPLAVDFYRGFDGTGDPQLDTIELKLTGTDSLIAGNYIARVANIPTPDGGVQQAAESWTFSIYECGNSVCEAGETTCSCSRDCGACSGCCRNGTTCLAGTEDRACGSDGSTCQDCFPNSSCFNGIGCLK